MLRRNVLAVGLDALLPTVVYPIGPSAMVIMIAGIICYARYICFLSIGTDQTKLYQDVPSVMMLENSAVHQESVFLDVGCATRVGTDKTPHVISFLQRTIVETTLTSWMHSVAEHQDHARNLNLDVSDVGKQRQNFEVQPRFQQSGFN